MTTSLGRSVITENSPTVTVYPALMTITLLQGCFTKTVIRLYLYCVSKNTPTLKQYSLKF